MIVRIVGEGQFEVPESCVAECDRLDQELVKAVESGDEVAFHAALEEVLAEVRRVGKPLAPEVLVPSDLALPDYESSLEDVRRMLEDNDVAMNGDTSAAS
jgi:hypothetical protein